MALIRILVAASVLAVAGAPRSQLIAPRAMAGVEGTSATVIPFGLSSAVRYQCLYDADQVPFSGPTLISEIRYRADANGGNAIPRKAWLTVHLDLSTSTVESDSASTVFDENHGVDRQRVSSQIQLELPAQPPWPSGGPRPAEIVVPLSSPWWFGTTPVRGGPVPRALVVDLQILSQPAGAMPYPLDSPFTCDSMVSQYGQLGPGCLTSAGLPVQVASSDDLRAAGRVDWTITDMPANAPYTLLIWLDATGNWLAFDPSGVPLPQIAPLPALLHPFSPDCYLNVRVDGLQLAGVANATGVGRLGLSIPSDRGLVGTTLHAQALVRDLAANRLGYVTSRGVRSTVCGPLGCARVYRIGDAAATSGSVTFGAASIIELR